jgi:hypothetical protein
MAIQKKAGSQMHDNLPSMLFALCLPPEMFTPWNPKIIPLGR